MSTSSFSKATGQSVPFVHQNWMLGLIIFQHFEGLVDLLRS